MGLDDSSSSAALGASTAAPADGLVRQLQQHLSAMQAAMQAEQAAALQAMQLQQQQALAAIQAQVLQALQQPVLQHPVAVAPPPPPSPAPLAAAAAASAPAANAPRLRLSDLPKYDGRSGAALDNWQLEMEQQFAFCNITEGADAQHVAAGAATFKEGALQWWASLPQPRPATWEALLAALRERFQPVTTADLARKKLDALQQGAKQSVHDYITAFRRLLMSLPDMSPADSLHRFLSGLRAPIATQLRINGVKTLEASIAMAARVGTLGELASAAPASSSSSSAAGGSTDMELDAIEGLEPETGASPADVRAEMLALLNAMREERSGPPRSGRGGRSGDRDRRGGLPRFEGIAPELVKQRMDAKQCVGCGKEGHRAINCPQRKIDPATFKPRWGN